jgi:hypothetical protein
MGGNRYFFIESKAFELKLIMAGGRLSLDYTRGVKILYVQFSWG